MQNTFAQSQKISSGGFESNSRGWNTNKWESSGTIGAARDTSSPISGRAGARIDIEGKDDPSSADWFWHNFEQTFAVTAGRTYIGTYKARASKPVAIAAQISEADSPYRGIVWTEARLDKGVREFRFVGVSEFSGKARIFFTLAK